MGNLLKTGRPRSHRGRGTVSGTTLVLAFVVIAAATVLSVLLLSPRLQDDVAAQLSEVVDRSVLATGSFDGEEWTVAAEISGDGTCVSVELDGRRAGEVCDGEGGLLREVGVTPMDRDPRWFFTGITDPDLQVVRLDLSEGDPLILRVQRPRDSTAGFYVTALDPGVAVERVTAVNVRERDLGSLVCQPSVATIDGVGSGCRLDQQAQGG